MTPLREAPAVSSLGTVFQRDQKNKVAKSGSRCSRKEEGEFRKTWAVLENSTGKEIWGRVWGEIQREEG